MRHQCLNFLKRHPLLDRTLHPHQANSILVFEQLADHTHTPVAQVIDVIHTLGWVGSVLQINEVLDRRQNIVAPEGQQIGQTGRHRLLARLQPVRNRDMLFAVKIQLVIQLQSAHKGQVVTLGIEKQVVEEIRCGF